jgi:hypothetical protein
MHATPKQLTNEMVQLGEAKGCKGFALAVNLFSCVLIIICQQVMRNG